ncbi:hypothetical protein CDIK_4156 [Cucumispora dikerogammari]|nr:hypothetical protein CDIK_4156 [Cucumispora dikerogammari]
METRTTLNKKLQNAYAVFSFCSESGLIKKNQNCKFCRKRMILTTHHREDGVIWVCWSSKCKKFKRSIRHNTIFSGIKIPLKNCSSYVRMVPENEFKSNKT